MMEESHTNPCPFTVNTYNTSFRLQSSMTQRLFQFHLPSIFMKNHKEADNGSQLQWLKVKWFQLDKGSDPDHRCR